MITTERILQQLDAADQEGTSELVLEIERALRGFESGRIARLLSELEKVKPGFGVRVAVGLGLQVGYSLRQAEELENSVALRPPSSGVPGIGGAHSSGGS